MMKDQNRLSPSDALSQAMEQLKNLFAGGLPRKGYFDGFQRWLQDRHEDWSRTSLRIGLVGITSAGKSTFINALAGEDILPRGAQPTSGILVMCRQAKERKLKVMFKDQSEFLFEGEECTPTWIKRYGDEEENPSNEQGVQEMHLHLPKLMIPSNYDLIDSPGLDAFGLQGHEELTLRTLIPLVDVVLFLTTTKSTSDRENLKALGNICSESKPAIVIQTHKDAVEPRYMKGGRILESAEEALEKHHTRVRELLKQTVILEDAHVIQVSSIQALNCRLKNPDDVPEKIEEWHESGFHEVVKVLEKLHSRLSRDMAKKRLRLLLKEVQQVLDRVKTDYFSARGKEKEAQHYRDLEKNRLQELQESLPSEQEPNFPDVMQYQQDIAKVKDFYQSVMDKGSDQELENLTTQVRDKIKSIEKQFFQQSDEIEERLKKLAEELSIDLDAIKPEMQKKHTDLPQIKRYEEVIRIDTVEEAGMSGRVKRILGKFLQKKEWGFRDKNITNSFVDREQLKNDLTDYHSIYRIRMTGYLKQWIENWKSATAAILNAIAQRRDDLEQDVVIDDPEPYRLTLNHLRTIRDFLETQLSDSEQDKGKTTSFSAYRYRKKKESLAQTTRTQGRFDALLPLLHACRTLAFTKKTHRFWFVARQLAKRQTPIRMLISTPFSHEISDYLTMIGDLPTVEEETLASQVVFYGKEALGSDFATQLGVPCQEHIASAQEQRELWFTQASTVFVFHDKLLENENGMAAFEKLVSQVDVIWRMVDLHQIGHEQTRLNKLPIRNILDENKERLGYIGAGVDRLFKGGQFIDAFKSYSRLREAPGFGLRPFVLSDGEELLTSLLWLATSIGSNKDEISDELQAFDVLTRTQSNLLRGRESFIRSFFREVKNFRDEQRRLQELES